MKRNIKRMVALFGVVLTLVCSVAPSYYVYADEPVSQEVTSDDNIVQKILNYSESMWGAVVKNANGINTLSSDITNRMKETIASLMNGGGIYVDSNGDYVFTNEASQQLYDSMMASSTFDAKVVSNFSDFTYYADGYVNYDYLQFTNLATAWAKNSEENGYSGNYILYSARFTEYGNIKTELYAYKLPDNFGYLAFNSFFSNGTKYRINFYNTNGTKISIPCYHGICSYNPSDGSYTDNISIDTNVTNSDTLRALGNITNLDDAFIAFPYYSLTVQSVAAYYNIYCNNSVILGKTVAYANGLQNQTTGIISSYNNIGTVNKTIIEDNNWENIYNNYVTNVNIDYQEDPDITTADLRKIMKKYSDSIISAIQSGTGNIEETVSISNKYLQAISVDVRNISDKLNELTDGGSGGGITPEQYNSIMGKLTSIDNNAIDIADSVSTISSDIDAIYEDTHGISEDMAILLENTGDTNTNLVAIDTLLQQINNKLRNRKTDNPLPDPDFWDNLDDELDDYTNTMMEDLIFKLQMIGTVLQGVVPFGYLVVLNVMVNALAEEPEEPVFEIDLQSNGATAIPVNWQGSIDLSWVDDIMPIVRSFEVILFIIGLIWATFNVFTALGSLL